MSLEVNSTFALIVFTTLYLIFGGIFFNSFYGKILGWNLVSKKAPTELSNHFIGANSEVSEGFKLFLSFFYCLFLWPIELFNFTPKSNSINVDSGIFKLYWNRCKLDRKASIGMIILLIFSVSVPGYGIYKVVENSSKEQEAKIFALGSDWAAFYKAMSANESSRSENIIDACDFSKYRDLNPNEMSFVLGKIPDSWVYPCQKKFIKKYQESRKK